MDLPIPVVEPVPLSFYPPSTSTTVMYVVELLGSLISTLVRSSTVYQDTFIHRPWVELMSHAGLSITHGAPGGRNHIWTYAGASRNLSPDRVTVPVLRIQEYLLLPTWENITTVRVLHSIPLLTHLAGTQTILYGTMRTVIQEAIAVIPHVLLGL